MKHRTGDRRSHPRYEILGTLGGSLEVWRRLEVRNLGPGGALVERSEALPVGATVRGRLLLHRYSWDVRAEVRYVSALDTVSHRPRFAVGMQFPDRLADLDEVLERLPLAETSNGRGADRRGAPRFECAGDATLGVPEWQTVSIRDLSLGGAALLSPIALESGERAQLHARLGDSQFQAIAEVRRVERQNGSNRDGYAVSAAFVSMSEGSRRALTTFLTASET